VSAVLVYPQLTSGALAQFPLRKQVSYRTVVNQAADGSSVKYADSPGGRTEWELQYSGLTDAELASLAAFHLAAEGTLNGFTFVDPCGNLAAWSEDLQNAVWQTAPRLALTAGVPDVCGGSAAWTLSNSGAGPQSILQTINAPSSYVYSFSVWVRSATASAVTLILGGERSDCVIGPEWRRLSLTWGGDGQTGSVTFGVETSAFTSIDVFGFQVEAQGRSSGYRPSQSGGVYEGARLADDTFLFTTEQPNRHSATVRIVYADHL